LSGIHRSHGRGNWSSTFALRGLPPNAGSAGVLSGHRAIRATIGQNLPDTASNPEREPGVMIG
jgi:hypothetical protein